jgi:APA family basic amino acid/polyamine antiporter
MAAGPPRRTALDAILKQARTDRTRLNSGALGPFSLTTLGIASVVGAGIFVTTGEAAANYAGPAVVVSFVLAGLAAALTAVCYAELAAMIPAAGSTYSYAYATFGMVVAWIIGWDLLLEYLFAASTVAVGWSGYAVSLLDSIGPRLPAELTNPPFGRDAGWVNLPAVVIVALTSAVLVIGVRQSARANNAMVLLKMAVLVLFVVFGIAYVDPGNWEPFVPPSHGEFGDYGTTGILRAAGVVFFAYIGFDAVSTAAAEARDPQRTVPIGLLATVAVSTVLYVAIGLVMTGLVDYRSLDVADPISRAIAAAGPALGWLRAAIDVAAVVGLASTVLVTFYGQTRILMRMSSDGMLPPAFGRVGERFRTPGFATVMCGIAGAVIAGVLPINILGELVSIGTLLSFLIVCGGVLVLRRTRPDLPRPFRVPAVGVVAPLGILAALSLMLTLPPDTWIRLGIWLALGGAVFLLYSRRRSAARFAELEREDPPAG